MGLNNYLDSGFSYIYLAGIITFYLGCIFLFNRDKKEYLYYLSIFWSFAVLATGSNILYFHFEKNIFILLNSIFYLFEAYYLLKAVHIYFNNKLEKIYLTFLKIFLFIILIAFVFEQEYFILAPGIFYLSIAFIKTAIIFLLSGFNKISQFTALVAFLFGLNLLIFPYLRIFDWFNNYGIFIRGLFALLFGLATFAIYYEDLQLKIKIREEQYQKLFNQSPAGMLLLDKNGKILKVNKAVAEYTGYNKKELIGSSMFETLVPLKFKIRAMENIKEILNGKDKEYIMETFDKNNNKRYFLMKETKFILPDYTNCVLSMRIDYTDYRKQQQKIRYLSYHDNLTKLYNRTFMEEEMKRLNQSRQLPISIIMIDVNGLKLFNDTYGHKKGDQLLIKTAEILKVSTRKEDVVARWAGDEFVILLPRTTKKEMELIKKRIDKKCQQTVGDEILVSLAVGAGIKENIAEDIFDVLDEADEKMYKHKMKKSGESKKLLIKNIINHLAEKSFESSEHLKRMKNSASKFANYLKLNSEQKNKLILIAEFHDIGKITVSEEILKKKGALNSWEWKKIKEHSEAGYKIAAASKEFASITREILHHHEYWNGKGYPAKLKEEEIPFLARIISIIDAYEIMRNKNIYNKKLNKSKALEELKNNAGSQFDPDLVEKFIQFIN